MYNSGNVQQYLNIIMRVFKGKSEKAGRSYIVTRNAALRINKITNSAENSITRVCIRLLIIVHKYIIIIYITMTIIIIRLSRVDKMYDSIRSIVYRCNSYRIVCAVRVGFTWHFSMCYVDTFRRCWDCCTMANLSIRITHHVVCVRVYKVKIPLIFFLKICLTVVYIGFLMTRLP